MNTQIQTYIEKLLAGTLQERDRLKLIRWFESLPEHESAKFFEELGLQMENLSEQETAEIEKELQRMQETRTLISKSRQSAFPFFKIAATILLLLACGVILNNYIKTVERQKIQPKTNMVWKEVKNPARTRSRILLPDSSFVWLNAGSSISYPDQFNDSVRQVRLDGEAYFEIKRNIEKPFEVLSRHFTTQVLGTSFNVKAFEAEPMTVTVASGRVKVFDERTEQILSRNEQVEISTKSGLSRIKTVEAEEWVSWTKGILNLDNKTLEQAAREMERWYGVDIQIANPQLKHCMIAGQHTNASLRNLLESLVYVLGLKYTYENNTVLISGSNCIINQESK